MTDPRARRSFRQCLPAIGVVVLAFLVPTVGLIVSGVDATASFADQQEYHLPTVHRFHSQWPGIDFSSYPAAMTPGYHLLMAGVHGLGGDVVAMRWVTLGIGAGLLGTLAWAVASRGTRTLDAVLLCLPLAWSQYVVASSVYVSPHNLAWWGVLLVLLIAVGRAWSLKQAAFGGLLLAATVFVRQIHLWAAAPLTAAAWAAAPGQIGGVKGRTARAAIAGLMCLPAAAVVFAFYKLWGGLAPSSQPWARPADGINLAAIVMVLATFGLLTPLLIARLPRGSWQWFVTSIGLVIGLLLALAGPTTWNFDAGRWSGLWNHGGRLGLVADRSILITALAVVGGGCAGLLLALAGRRWLVWSAALAGFVAASASVNLAWQRYYEPMVLMTAVLILRDAEGGNATRGQRIARGAVVVLQLVLTAIAFRAG